MDADQPVTPPVVAFTVWGVPARRVPAAIGRMGLDWLHLHLRGTPGLRFAKLLGTGDGRTFTLRDADPLHWALLTVWDDDPTADRFATGTTHRRWNALSDERLDVRMSPIASRGRWAGREPFAVPPARPILDGPIASITRARIRPSRALSFWRAVPAVSADLSTVAGLSLAIGIGEAPIGLQGTFSLWRSNAALNDFAHRRPAHADVVRRTGPERWYAEEMFARFAVHSVTGTFAGRDPWAQTRPAQTLPVETRPAETRPVGNLRVDDEPLGDRPPPPGCAR